jgi:hypothetical protein
MKTQTSLLALVAVVLLGSSNTFAQQANSGASTATIVKTVQVSVPVKEAEVGQQVQVTVVATDAAGKTVDEKPSTYFAGPFDIAAVDDDGKVKLFGTGQVTVGAIVGGVPALTTFVVKPPSINAIELTAMKTSLVVGDSVQINAVTRVLNGVPRTGVPINWTTDNASIATVDAGGVVTGVGPGTAVVTAAAGSATTKIPIAVIKSNLRSLSITAGAKSARAGDVVYFKAAGDPAQDFTTRWSVSGSGASVDADGGFVAELPGTYIVTGTSGNLSSSASIVVTPRNLEREVKIVGRAPMKEFQGAEQWIIGNYAYYSTIADRFFVYDLSDPSKPVLTDTIKVDARLVNDIMTTADGKILVISRENASNRKNGIAFYDTSDPAHPKLISEYTTTVTGGVHSAFVNDHYVYLTDDATGSMRVIDFKDVKNPKEIARWQTENPLAGMVQTKEGEHIAGRYLHDLQVKDGLAYLAYWHDGLVILDVGAGLKGGSPEHPQLVSQLRFNHNELYGDGWLAGTHSVYRYKNYVFVGDEVFPALFDIKSTKRFPIRGIIHVVDVSDIHNPRKVAEYPVPEGAAHNMWVEDDVMYVGYYSGGGRVVDVSGELRGDLYRQGREMARVWTGDPDGFRANLPFTWGAQPHKGLIYFNDIHSGLWIVKLGEKIDKGSTTAPGP